MRKKERKKESEQLSKKSWYHKGRRNATRLGMQYDGRDGEERLLYKKGEEKKGKYTKRGKEKTTDENETKPIPTLRTPRGDCTNKQMKSRESSQV